MLRLHVLSGTRLYVFIWSSIARLYLDSITSEYITTSKMKRVSPVMIEPVNKRQCYTTRHYGSNRMEIDQSTVVRLYDDVYIQRTNDVLVLLKDLDMLPGVICTLVTDYDGRIIIHRATFQKFMFPSRHRRTCYAPGKGGATSMDHVSFI